MLLGERRFISLSFPARGQALGCRSAVGSRVPVPGPAALLAANREGGGPGWADAAPAGKAPNGRGRGSEPGSTESPSELRQTRGEHRAPRSAARLLPSPCPVLPARASASSPRAPRSSRAPVSPERAPCAARRAGSVRTPRVHRGPGTARRGSGRRGCGGGGSRCSSVAHPIGLNMAASGLGRRGGGPAHRAVVAGPARHCPRSSAASLRPLPAVLGGVRTRAQSPFCPKRRRTRDPRLPELGSAGRTPQPPPATGPAQPGPPSSQTPSQAVRGVELCCATFLCLFDGVVGCFRAAGSEGQADPPFLASAKADF